jgi:hypothetical protein
MDNTNNISGAILQTTDGITDGFSGSNSSNGSGFFDSFKNINLTTWLIIILILAFLGFNIFVYLAKGTQDITNVFAPLIQQIFGTVASTTGQIVDVSAEGAKTVVSGTANAVNTGLSDVQNIMPNNTPTTIKSQPVQNTIQQPDILSNNTLNKALNSSKSQQSAQNNEYEADYAASSIQGGGKSGWCYIGEDRGFRSCSQVDSNDKCMSGQIFPSQDICVNPNLRA